MPISCAAVRHPSWPKMWLVCCQGWRGQWSVPARKHVRTWQLGHTNCDMFCTMPKI